jgi:phospholipid/cholesterol/gamma-HCH transport system ATP-binding protein
MKTAAEPIVVVRGLVSAVGDRAVLDGIDLEIRRGEVFVVMGPSGCGKTTLLRHLAGLQPPTAGQVVVAGQDLRRAPPRVRHELRLRCGVSFQGGALLGSLTVLENVELPLRENTALPRAVIRETARMKLDMVGLLPAAHQLPAALSGGMRKRAAIARAIALDPDIVFFDEPSAGLDPITAAEVDNVIIKLNQVFGITMVVVTHDLPSASTIADRIVVLLDGRVVAIGSREQVWNDPDPRIRDFIERRLRAEEGRAMDIVAHLEA